MFKQMHKNESGQTALETAIILIAFVVVASVFAFTILSAGSASTEKGEQAIYSGLEGVQSSMAIKGAVIAQGSAGLADVATITFTVALASGGDPVNLDDANATKVVTIGYRDAAVFVNNVDYTVVFITNVGTANDLLEDGELAEIKVKIKTHSTPIVLAKNTAFTLELKPPTGGILQINRTTPAAIEAVMDLN